VVVVVVVVEEEEEEEEGIYLYSINDTIAGPRAPAVNPGRVTQCAGFFSIYIYM
jgi:hypothetical protein